MEEPKIRTELEAERARWKAALNDAIAAGDLDRAKALQQQEADVEAQIAALD